MWQDYHRSNASCRSAPKCIFQRAAKLVIFTLWFEHSQWLHVQNDEVRRTNKQPHLSATVQSQNLSVFGLTAWMLDEADAKDLDRLSPRRLEETTEMSSDVLGSTLYRKKPEIKEPPRTKRSTWLRSDHSVKTVVDVWCYTLLVVHARKREC